MSALKKTDWDLLASIADIREAPLGAYSIRRNGAGYEMRSTQHVTITPKRDQPGIDITVAPHTRGETVHIPVIVTQSGLSDLVYNTFTIGEGADVTIVAGCGIHNDGCESSRHDGIHTFYIGKGAHLSYVEKHYGEGSGSGGRVLNPTTIVHMGDDSVCEMEMVQIKGVDSTLRETTAVLSAGAKLTILEKLMTHGRQTARSNVEIDLNGPDSSAQIISRSVAKDSSEQVFYPRAVGNNRCRAHVQCDSIIMDAAKIRSIPEIAANHADAQIIHEAAIGRINSDQLIKLQTFGLTEAEAEAVIIEGFLK